jgi:hypothetical protein
MPPGLMGFSRADDQSGRFAFEASFGSGSLLRPRIPCRPSSHPDAVHTSHPVPRDSCCGRKKPPIPVTRSMGLMGLLISRRMPYSAEPRPDPGFSEGGEARFGLGSARVDGGCRMAPESTTKIHATTSPTLAARLNSAIHRVLIRRARATRQGQIRSSTKWRLPFSSPVQKIPLRLQL